jgi:hypothetical protein
MTILDENGLGDFIDAHYNAPGDRLFRMEQLPYYDVPHQAAELAAWRSGGEPDWSVKQPWLNTLAEERRRGLISERVRVLSARLTDDELRACNWGYPYTGRYEDIRVLRHGEHPIPGALLAQDYWIIADTHVALMHYDSSGRFGCAEILAPAELARYRDDRDAAWTAGEPFGSWWRRHGELHRRQAA